MKKYYLLLVFLSFIVLLPIQAQNKPFQFGFQGAVNMGWWATNAEGYSNNGIKVGGGWGVVADFFIMEGYSFTTGFNVLYLNGSLNMPHTMYDEQGVKLIDGNLERNYKTRYAELPLIFTMKTKEINDKFRIYGQFGFGLSFLLSAKADDVFSPNVGSQTQTKEENVYDTFHFTRESLILGAGIEVPIHGSTFARIGITFDNAFVNVLKGNNSMVPSVENYGRNSLMALNVAFIF